MKPFPLRPMETGKGNHCQEEEGGEEKEEEKRRGK